MSLDVNIYLDHTTPIDFRVATGVVTSHRIKLDRDVTVFLADRRAVEALRNACDRILGAGGPW